MNRKYIFSVFVLFLLPIFVLGLTKPSGDADIDSLSYIFYLYYDNGQLFADRDYQIKFDVIQERFAGSAPSDPLNYQGEIINLKSQTVKTFGFDPRGGNPAFTAGKIQVKAPYVPDGMRASFYNSQGEQLVTVFVTEGSICNDDGFCDSTAGENENVCANDCMKSTPTPMANAEPPSFNDESNILNFILYIVGGAAVGLGAWFGWKWWKKKQEGEFTPPAPIGSESAGRPLPPLPVPPPALSSNLPQPNQNQDGPGQAR